MRALSITLALALLCVTANLRANPNQAEPFAPLDIHGAEFSPELSATAQQLYQQARVLLTKMEGQYNNQRIASIDLKDVGKTYMALLRLRRIGAQLTQLGEPAGADFTRRGEEMMQSLNRLIGALKLLPSAPTVINNLATRGQQVSQNYTRQIPKLQKLAQQAKWSEAEKELYEILDELEQYSVFVNNDQSLAIYLPFRDIHAIITQGADQERKATARKLLTDRRAALRPDLPKLLADLSVATASVAKSGRHTIDGKELTGPELIAHFDNAWRQAHVAAMKTLGVEWARGPVVGQSVTPEAQQLQAEYQKFTTDVAPALAALIQADTARVNAADAAALYAAYLPAVADLADHAAGSPVEAALSKALDSLVNKSPELAANVKAYRAVTDETLRWRARIASEQAQAKAAQLPTLSSAAVAAFTTTKDAPGFWPADAARTDKARMHSPVGNVLTLLAPQAIGKPASVTAITSLGGTSSAGIARFHERLYARVPLPMEKFAPEVAALQAALFATEAAPPLTLVATQALRGAQRGDVVQAGGTISGVFVEGHIARFAALKEAAALILPLGSLPPTHADYDQVDQLVLRFDLQPTWLQQRYFVVEP